MLIALLIVAAIGLVTLKVCSGLAGRLDGVVTQIADLQDTTDDINSRVFEADEENRKLHVISRQYLGGLIEKDLLPHLGFKRPERSAFEKAVLAEVSTDPDFNS
jgi:hypothetical protein